MLVCAKLLRMRKLAAHCLMSGKPGKSGSGTMRMDREGNVLRPYEAVIIGTAVNIVKSRIVPV